MKKDPHPLSLKFAGLFSAVIVLLVIGGLGVYQLVLAAHNHWPTFQLFGGILLIATAITLTMMLLRQK
jgi:hypothetical protein